MVLSFRRKATWRVESGRYRELMRSKGSWGNRSVDVTPFLENEYNLILFKNYSYLMGYLKWRDRFKIRTFHERTGLHQTNVSTWWRYSLMLLGGKHFAFKNPSSTPCSSWKPQAAPKDRKKMQEGVFVKEKYFKSILKVNCGNIWGESFYNYLLISQQDVVGAYIDI